MRWLRRRLNRKILDVLYGERHELAKFIKEDYLAGHKPHPHTQGRYDGLCLAITIIEEFD